MKTANPNPDDRYRGKRYIVLVRQSNATEGTTSTEAQLNWMHGEGERLGMTLTEDLVLEGVTGSIPGKRKDLEQLFERKRTRDDFEVLMIQLMDRSTRSGAEHGLWFEHECARHGIRILYPGEDLPENQDAALWMKVAKYQAAKEQAKSISQRSTQGWLLALSQSRVIPISRTPYGCDRLYLSADGEPLFRIRCLADGSQLKLGVEDESILERFGPKSRFRKQKDQQPLIVPGEASAADAVRLMFEMHYGRDLGGRRIAVRLNGMGIVSPTGKRWSQRQVESIYEYPIYCGMALGNRSSQGIYNRRGESIPEAIHLDAIELASLTSPPRKLRPPEEWVWVEQSPMLDFLPPALRAKAMPLIEQVHAERYKRQQDPDRPTRSTNKHRDSPYLLTGLLVDSEHGEPLAGILCGRVGKKVCKYRHQRCRRGYGKGSPWNNYIRAAELENAVLDIVFEIVADVPSLRQRILDVMAELPSPTASRDQLEQLQTERTRLGESVRRIISNMTDDDRADMQPELDRLRSRRRELDAQIEKISGELEHAGEDPQAVADAVLRRLQDIPTATDALDVAAKRNLLKAFVERVEVDMATRNAEVFFRLPPWAADSALGASGEGRLAHSSPSPTVDETHPILSVPIAFADCRYDYVPGRRTVCYRCRRRAA